MDENTTLPAPAYSPFTRLGTTVQTRARRLSGQSGLAANHRWKRSPAIPDAKPTFTKTFPRYPEIPCRVFIPKPEACQPGLLPCYLSVHGGGFIFGKPELDDFFCKHLAQVNGICVISVGYRKSPRWKFPTPVQDVAGIVKEILEGTDLPIDRFRVCLGGFSTGATLALAASQTEELKGRLRGIVAFNPLTDMSVPPEDKLANIPKSDQPDRLGQDFALMVQRAYIPPNTDLRDPLLSPIFYTTLPRNLYIIGSEFDMWCAEAERLAVSLAAQEEGDLHHNEYGWEKGGVRWEIMRGWRHNFTHIVEKGPKEAERQQVVNELFNRVGRWLWERPYA